MSTNYWAQYKTHVQQTLGNFGSNTPTVLTFGLSAEIGELFDQSKNEIIFAKRFTDKLMAEVGDVFWYIASLEMVYQLPSPRFASFFGLAFEIHNREQINLLTTHSNCLTYCSEISKAITSGDVDELHYYLNKLLVQIFDFCTIYEINTVNCLQASINKLQVRHPEGFKPDNKKKFRDEYRAARKSILAKDEKEVLIKIKINKKAKQPYRAIQVTSEGGIESFNSGDIIVDFFQASQWVATRYKNIPYRINYSPLFREALQNANGAVFSGYIVEDRLISANEVRKTLGTTGNTVFAGNAYGLPILMNTSLKKLDDLLDYCSKRTKELGKA